MMTQAAVEVLVLGGRLVPEAGARPPKARRQVLEEGGRDRSGASSSDSSLSSSGNTGGSQTSGGELLNKSAVEDRVQQ